MGKSLIAVLLLAAAPAMAAEPPGRQIQCQASMRFSCAGEDCAHEIDEHGAPVIVSYSPETRRGELCTYTYCRQFELLAAPAAPAAPGQTRLGHTGFTLSEHAGSTPDLHDRPVVDFQLSFADDFSRFMLANVQDGGVGGWAGACTAGAP